MFFYIISVVPLLFVCRQLTESMDTVVSDWIALICWLDQLSSFFVGWEPIPEAGQRSYWIRPTYKFELYISIRGQNALTKGSRPQPLDPQHHPARVSLWTTVVLVPNAWANRTTRPGSVSGPFGSLISRHLSKPQKSSFFHLDTLDTLPLFTPPLKMKFYILLPPTPPTSTYCLINNNATILTCWRFVTVTL